MLTNDNTRVWVYQSNRRLNADEVTQIQDEGDKFCHEWAAHGISLSASCKVIRNYFLVLFVNENDASASGCSIDSSVAFIRKMEQKFTISLLNRMLLAYENTEGEVEVCDMASFEDKVKSGVLGPDSIVYNNTITNQQEFEKEWRIPMKYSWHKKYLV